MLGGCAFQSGPVNTANNLPAAVRVSLPAADSAEPAMAVDGEGNIYVLYVEHSQNKNGDKAADIFLQRFDGAMKAEGERARVNPNAGEAAAWRGDQPAIKIGADQKIYVGWNSPVKVPEGSASNLMLSVSSDGGKTFAAPVKVNDDTAPASHGMHALAVDGDKVYFAWLDERFLQKDPPKKMPKEVAKNGEGMSHGQPEPNAELYFAVSKDNGKTFSENKKLAGNICPCCKVSLLAAKDGRLYLSWRQVLEGDMRHIAVASSADTGESFTEPAIVSDDKWQLMICPVSGAPLAVDENNTLRVAWYTAGEAGAAGLYTAESKDQGKTFSPRVLVSEGAVFGTPIMFYDGKADFRVLWAANSKVVTGTISEGKSGPAKELIDGDLPSAAAAGAAGKHLFISYIKKEGDKRSIWLSETGN